MKNKQLTDIIIYPIKSLGGIHLTNVKLTQRGLQHDRRWMLVNDRNHFLTIRQHPEFLHFELSQEDDGFVITHRIKKTTLKIPFTISSGNTVEVKIWDDMVEALEAEEKYHVWFSEQLGQNCKLVYIPEEAPRRVEADWVKEEHHVSFADAYPYLIVGESTLADLNSKLEEKITMQRFRPNLVFNGGEAYEEYVWKDIAIGNGLMQCIKPCTRCIVTTMDPETTKAGKEPLKTLFKQKINDKMVFGENAIAMNDAEIAICDEIVVKTTKQSPYEPI
ncbi:MOSC domain-containing protein [Fulvivirga lutimaris]|uniref:MOSC domain-containing protein n=1 Tax=Fulvivirga lutimaris TaxID=1819566 RepID=UPI0012BBD39B|nr:MOSC N-terminal beta barrel domain-containing protein [Fulvivirga lutimaris]MTI38193.1 MOSC domain-containing protein [Fulvivirga lutimaris]